MKILLVQNSFLGDTILSTPLIAAIKSIHPNCELWMMTTPLSQELVRRDPLLSGTIAFDKRGRHKGIRGILKLAGELSSMKFDLAYSLHRSYRTAILLRLAKIPERIGFKNSGFSFFYTKRVERRPAGHEVERNLSLLESRGKFDGELRLFTPSDLEVSQASKEIVRAGDYGVLFPGSEWKTKRWKWEGFAETAKWLSKRGLKVVLLGSSKERPIAESIANRASVVNLSGQLGIADAMFLGKGAKVVVSNDSMALHLASAFKVPSVSIFCSTSPDFGFGPWKNRALVVEKTGLSCRPCRRHGSHSCPTGTERCMNEVPAERVINAIESLL